MTLTVKIETDCGIGFSEVVSCCDFIFSGIFYCNVTHYKRAIKGILVLLLGDNLKENELVKVFHIIYKFIREKYR